jgi:uncharacterized Zn-binding protein involved in type VI secretion
MKIFDINGREQGLDGDVTTTGAICQASLVQTSLEDGRMALRLGDKTSPCSVCGQVGEIVEGDDSFTWDGIPTAVHDALVLCGCPPGTNRLIASRSGRAGASRATPNAAAALHPAMPTSNTPSAFYPHTTPAPGKIFARTFVIRDSETGQPLANRTFTATVDGQQKSGTTDSNGMARVEGSSVDSVVSLHVMFRSPARELNELAGMTTREVTTTTRVETLIHGDTPKPMVITVNDRAATREAVIRKVRELGHAFVDRSEWHAKPPKKLLDRDWNYTMIALHHAGRSYSCGAGDGQMRYVQKSQMAEKSDDVGYHFGIDCSGVIYEGRDIRFKGEHLRLYNSNVIGIVLLDNLSSPEEGGGLTAIARTTLSHFGVNTTMQVPDPQQQAAINLIRALSNEFLINQLGGHREFPHQTQDQHKICPGNVGMNFVKVVRATTGLHRPVRE